MNNKPKPDDRRNNVKKIQEDIDNTYHNISEAEKTLAVTDSKETKEEIKAKNERREEAIEGMRKEIRDEVSHAKLEGYKF